MKDKRIQVASLSPEADGKPPYRTSELNKRLDVRSFNMGEISGKAKERELCKRDVCMYCGGRAIGYRRIPDGPNDAGNWTHQCTTTMRSEDRVLCQVSSIFARENFERP